MILDDKHPRLVHGTRLNRLGFSTSNFRCPQPVVVSRGRVFSEQRKFETGTGRILNCDPEFSTVAFNDFLADRQAYPITPILGTIMQAPEDNKNVLPILVRNADAIV
jgi:hypothetical protein